MLNTPTLPLRGQPYTSATVWFGQLGYSKIPFVRKWNEQQPCLWRLERRYFNNPALSDRRERSVGRQKPFHPACRRHATSRKVSGVVYLQYAVLRGVDMTGLRHVWRTRLSKNSINQEKVVSLQCR